MKRPALTLPISVGLRPRRPLKHAAAAALAVLSVAFPGNASVVVSAPKPTPTRLLSDVMASTLAPLTVSITVQDLTTGTPISPDQTIKSSDVFQVTITTDNVDCAGQAVVTALGGPGTSPSVLVQDFQYVVGPDETSNSATGPLLTAGGSGNRFKISTSCNGVTRGQFATNEFQFFVSGSAPSGSPSWWSPEPNPPTLGVQLSVTDLTTGQPVSPDQTVNHGDSIEFTITTNNIDCAGQGIVTTLSGSALSSVVHGDYIIGPAVGSNSLSGKFTVNGAAGNSYKISTSCNGAEISEFAFDTFEFVVGSSSQTSATSVAYALIIKNYKSSDGILAFSKAQLSNLETQLESTLTPEPGFSPEVVVLPRGQSDLNALLYALGGSQFLTSITTAQEKEVKILVSNSTEGDQITTAVAPDKELAIIIPFAQPPPSGTTLDLSFSYQYAPCGSNSTVYCTDTIGGEYGSYIGGGGGDPFSTRNMYVSAPLDFNVSSTETEEIAGPGGGLAEVDQVLGTPLADLQSGTNPMSESTNGTVTVTAAGVGSVLTGVYENTASIKQLRACAGFLQSCNYFDVAVPSGSSITSLTISACFNGDTSVSWYDPSTGGWATIVPGEVQGYAVSSSSSPPCVQFTVTGSTTPNLSDLSGTVFVATPVLAPTWSAGPSGPSARSAPAMATNPSGLTLLFGGGGPGNTFLSDTWALSSPASTWELTGTASTGPSGRTGASMVWDQEMGEFILFGGVSSTGFHFGTWAFDPGSDTWAKLATTGSPTPRAGAGMAAEPDGNIVLFGGLSYTGFLGDTWVFDPSTNTWAEQHPLTSPSARFEPAMAADSSTGTVVLFGGAGASGDKGDTWSYTGGTWAQLSPAGTPPSARYGTGLAYDSSTGDFVLVDGDTASGYSAATYTYDPTTSTWAALVTTASPSPRAGAGFSYDFPANAFVQFGGFNGTNFLADTWELPG